MNTHDKIELPEHDCLYESTNEQGYIDLEPAYRKSTVLRLLEADRKRRGEPVAWAMFADNGNIRIWARKPISHPDCVPLYTAPQPAEPVTIPETVASDNPEPVAWIQRSYLNLIRESNVALHNVVVRGSILDGDGDVVPLFTAPKPAEPVSQHPDDAAVDAFATAMKAKLKRAREEKGRGGWQDMSATVLSDMLREHVQKGDPVDVANLAMMLHQNGQGITPAEPVKRKRRYAQGTALGEFGIIPMCDQVDDEPVKVLSDLPVTEQEDEEWKRLEKQQ